MTHQEGPQPISPELALVCPELRAAAIAALPHRDPDAFLPQRRLSAPEYLLLRVSVAAPVRAESPAHVSLPAAISAYVARRALLAILHTIATLGLVAAAFAVVAAAKS